MHWNAIQAQHEMYLPKKTTIVFIMALNRNLKQKKFFYSLLEASGGTDRIQGFNRMNLNVLTFVSCLFYA